MRRLLPAVLLAAVLCALLTALAGSLPGPVSIKYSGRAIRPEPSYAPPRPVPRALDELFTSTDVPRFIPDGPNGLATSTLFIPTEVAISDLNVNVTITHTWIRDLRISLIAPDSVAEIVLLDLYPGYGAVNMTDTWFNDESARSVRQDTAPFTGRLRPQQPLSGFDGLLAAGTWTLRVLDHFQIDTGSIQSWSIDLNPFISLAGTVHSAETGQPLPEVEVLLLDSPYRAVTDSNGAYAIDLIAAGAYTVRFSKATLDTLLTDVQITDGQTVNLSPSLTSNFEMREYVTTAAPAPIPDTSSASMSLFVPDSLRIEDLDVTVWIHHTWPWDLDLYLMHVFGTDTTADTALVKLAQTINPADTTGDNILGARFDDEATQFFEDGTPPFAARFRPVDALTLFDDRLTAGEWILQAVDRAEQDMGVIDSFRLHALVHRSAAVDPGRPPVARDFVFHGNYPNPFNSRTEFRFELARPGRMSLVLYNALGQEAARVADGVFAAGTHTVTFDAGGLASGLYFARLADAGGAAVTRKLVLLR